MGECEWLKVATDPLKKAEFVSMLILNPKKVWMSDKYFTFYSVKSSSALNVRLRLGDDSNVKCDSHSFWTLCQFPC